MPKIKTSSALSTSDVLRAGRWRFNPLGSITPTQLTRYLDAFEGGYLREAANLWQFLEDRDDLLRTVIAKRKKSAARHGWTVLPKQGLPAHKQKLAARHVDALEFFYSNLECENAVDSCEKGSFKMLARQMLDAVGKRYAVHEIIWVPDRNLTVSEGADRRFLTARFRFVPLGFFENTTGTLRFLDKEGAVTGVPLPDGEWMVTVGDGLMKASSVAWMSKYLALNDWLSASQRQGTPALHGTTSAARDTDEWNALLASMEDVLDGQSLLTTNTDQVEVLEMLNTHQLPFPALVERMDRLMAALWRGADLSTISRDRGYGASLQEKETFALEEDDSSLLTETLNRYVDTHVIHHVFGPDIEPLANVRVLLTPRQWTSMDLQIDQFLIQHGAPISIQDTMLRYGRALPQPGEEVLHAATRPDQPMAGSSRIPATEKLANQSQEPVPGEGMALANTVGEKPDWIQLSPYGEFPHSWGLQRVTRESAESMASRFNSFPARLARLGGGVPIYIGHPDLPGSHATADKKAYGWITELEAREDGLFGLANWSETGRQLVQKGQFKYVSPYWTAVPVAQGVQPTRLLSAGLTNQPNLPVRALANVASTEVSGLKLPHTFELTEEKESAPEASVTEGRDSITNTPPPRTESQTANLAHRKTELQEPFPTAHRIREAVRAKLALGLKYDQAWSEVKEEFPGFFAEHH